MTDRRTFLHRSLAALAAGVAIPALVDPAPAAAADESSFDAAGGAARSLSADTLSAIGLQLYTVREQMQQSVDRTLARVAAIGYKEVEFAGYFGAALAVLGGRLQSLGLSAPSAHVSTTDIRKHWAKTLDDASVVGHRYLVLASIDAPERTLVGLRRVFEELNTAGEAAAKHGIQLAYHNHDFEWRMTDRLIPFDLMLQLCDPKLVKFEMDLYWITKAGRDPLAYFASNPSRFPLIHVKDMDASGAFADVGAGKIPFATYFAKRRQAGMEHFFVERDDAAETGDAFASIERSYAYLRGLVF